MVDELEKDRTPENRAVAHMIPPMGIEPVLMDAADGDYGLDDREEARLRFQAQAPPPMFITRKRLMRGIIFGALAAGTFAAVLGAAMAAVSIDAPAVSAVVIALIGRAACSSGFGGRSAGRTKTRAPLMETPEPTPEPNKATPTMTQP